MGLVGRDHYGKGNEGWNVFLVQSVHQQILGVETLAGSGGSAKEYLSLMLVIQIRLKSIIGFKNKHIFIYLFVILLINIFLCAVRF